MGATIPQRGCSGELLESFHERAVIVEATVQGDLCDACSSAFESFTRMIHAHLFHKAVSRHMQTGFEDSHEVAGGDLAHGSQLLDRDALCVVLRDMIDGGQ